MNRINVKFSFLLFNALLFLLCDGEMILGFYAVCLLHELGHIAALRATGGELRRVELSCFGIKMTAAPARDVKRGAAVLLSGPAANLLLFALLHALGCGGRIAALSLAAGVFNLLPFSFLDGGALIGLLAEGSPCERKINITLCIFKGALAGAVMLNLIAELCKT